MDKFDLYGCLAYRLAIVNAHTDLKLTFYLRQGNHCLAIGEVCVKAFLSSLDLDISYIYMYLLSLPIVLCMNTEVEEVKSFI